MKTERIWGEEKMNRMKRILAAALAVTVMAGAAGCGRPAGGAGGVKVIQVGYTTAPDKDDPYYVFATKFAELVAQKSRGSVKITPMASGQLGQETEMWAGMQLGTVDMAIMTNGYVSNFLPAAGVFDLPFVFPDSRTAAKILDGKVGKEVLAAYDSQGIKGLAYGEGGFRDMVTSNKAIRTPADFKGLKIRSMETKTYLATYKALGANAVPMAWSETITGLQQKTIDGLDIPISVAYSNGFPQVAKELSITNQFYSPLILCISKNLWNRLSEDQRSILQESAVEAGRYNRARNASAEKDMLQKLQKQGMTIVGDVNRAAFQKDFANFYEAQKANIGGSYVDDLLAELKKAGSR